MNILFLMADEMRFDAPGFMGNAVARTPHLDRLAANAVVFDRAYTASPVCIPGRQCLATGRYPQRAGCVHFGEDIPPGSQTFARWFSEHGYYTVACGKLHHRGPDQMQGWMHRFGSEVAVDWPQGAGNRSAIGRRKWRGAEEIKLAGPGLSPLALHDDYTVEGARAFLKMHFEGLYPIPVDTPLMLMVSLQQPHFPLRTEPGLLDYYLDKVPVFANQPPAPEEALRRGYLGAEEGITPDELRRATATYYGMVEQTDGRIGRVLAALEEAGQDLNEWAVVFTGDHGEMLGEHGVWEKRKFYEGSARVPLFLSSPGRAPGRSGTLCNLVDLFPTLAALAGLPAPPDIDGRDIFAANREDVTFSQYGEDHFMVRKGVHKYLLLGEEEVLFDLDRDPSETKNFIHAPESQGVASELRGKLDDFRAQQALP